MGVRKWGVRKWGVRKWVRMWLDFEVLSIFRLSGKLTPLKKLKASSKHELELSVIFYRIILEYIINIKCFKWCSKNKLFQPSFWWYSWYMINVHHFDISFLISLNWLECTSTRVTMLELSTYTAYMFIYWILMNKIIEKRTRFNTIVSKNFINPCSTT